MPVLASVPYPNHAGSFPGFHLMLQHHAVFQGYNFFHHIGLDRNMRERFRDSPHYDHAAEFVELYDNAAFDAKGEQLPLEHFEPILRRVMAQPQRSIYKAAVDRLR